MSDCVLWGGYVAEDGYGELFFGERMVGAHRYVYEQERGPIPPGMQVHHTCHTPLCVNVNHLLLLDAQQHAGAEGHGKLTLRDARLVKALLASGARGIDVASVMGCSKQQVCNIKKGRVWANA